MTFTKGATTGQVCLPKMEHCGPIDGHPDEDFNMLIQYVS
jgi:hypothetical protein